MAQSTPVEDKQDTDKSDRPKAEPLEARYGKIGCAAVKAAAMHVKPKSKAAASKGFASQTKR